MAININKDSTKPNNNLNEYNYKAKQIPATQGNVIETLNTYNDELKKKYYDKEQTRADENALQKSIMTLVKLLDNNNNFTGKTLPCDITVDENNDNKYRLESYEGLNGKLPACQDSSENKTFTESGLIQQINIISHLLSGKKDLGETDWAADTYGNNVGENEHTNCVPVIGYTRNNSTNYTAEITKQTGDDGHFKVNIKGLNTDGTTDISDKTVLSEQQIADMISKSVYNVLGQYDSRITGILAYLIYHAGELPKSYEYVLGHYYTDEIKKAPLYITYEPSGENGNRWSVHDLNGENEFGIGTGTEDFWYAKNSQETEDEDIIFFKSKNVDKWKIKIPEPVGDNGLTDVDVYYGGSSTRAYSLPIPKKTFTLNLGLEKTTTRISYKCKFGSVEYPGNFDFSDGVGYVSVPQGADITVTLPEDFDGDLFYKYQYGEATKNKITIETTNSQKTFTITMENDQEVYAKVLTYTLKNGESIVSNSPIQRYYKTNSDNQADVTFEVSNISTVSKVGYSFTGTTLSGTSDGNKVTINISDIQTKEPYRGIESGEIIDSIDWKPKTFNVTVHYVLDKNKISDEDIPTYPTDTIYCTVGESINFKVDIPDNKTNPDYHIGTECGYDFVGLYSSTDLKEPITECPKVNNLTELYAVYDIKKYNYNLVLNDGSLNDIGVSTTGIKDWALKTDSMPEITRTGYKFEGWYTDINFANTTKVDNFKNQDATYYAKWEELIYTINFTLKTTDDDNIQPYFKYKSISVKASNFPVTLGEPVAEGYDFKGWKLEDAEKDTIKIGDFNNPENKTITLTATWTPKEVTVLEEIYYEMDGDGTDGNNKKYDLVQVIKKTGTVNNSYTKDNEYDIATGFTETKSDPDNLTNVSYKGDVLKRHFNRNTYTLKYHNEKANTDQTLTTQSFNYSDHNVLLENDPSAPNSDYYTFDCWVDKDGKKVTCIPAHTANDVDYYARYNQSAPVQGFDFEIERTKNTTNDTLTIKKIDDRPEKLYCLYKNNEPKEIETTNGITLNYNDIYNDSLKRTKYALIYFGSEKDVTEKRIIVNESSKVEVPLKFNSNEIADKEYKQDTSAGTLEKITKDILEYRFQNDEDNDGEWYELNKPLHVEKEDTTVKLRRKETFDRICSEAVDVTFSKKQKPSAPTNTDNQNIKVIRAVSIYQPGQIEVLNGAFGDNNNGPLQYRIFEKDSDKSSGSAWLNVERPSMETGSVYINVDKECTVYFRYGENAQYLASDSVSIDVDTEMHNVTFHLDKFPSKSGGYTGFPEPRNQDNSFTIQVKSGSQLYKCDEYINKVKEWKIFGYTPYVEGGSSSSTENVGGLQDSDRVLKFLYVKKDDGQTEVSFSELNVIDEDLDLYMRFTPSHPASDKDGNWTYTNEIEIENYKSSSSIDPIKIKEAHTLKSSDVSYGKSYEIKVIKGFNKDLLSEENLKSVLDWLDEESNLEKTISFKELKIVPGGNNSITTSTPISKNDCDSSLTFNYNENDRFSVCDDDKFGYKFRSVFNLTESTDNLPAVQFKAENGNADLDGTAVNGMIEQITIGNNLVPNFEDVVYFIDTKNQKIDFYWKGTPGTENFSSIENKKISCDNLKDEITVFFHSGFYDGRLYPAKKAEKVRIKRTVNNLELLNTTGNVIFEKIDNNGFTLKDGWKIKSKPEGDENDE